MLPAGIGMSLVLDVGTSAVKGALVAEDGGFLHVVERSLEAPSGRDGIMEQMHATGCTWRASSRVRCSGADSGPTASS